MASDSASCGFDVQIPENFFVEPSTGRCYPCGESPYEGVEFIWNHTNFWVNMQESTVKMDPSKPGKIGLPDISWDLKNTDKWEYVLETQDPLESLKCASLVDKRAMGSRKEFDGQMSEVCLERCVCSTEQVVGAIGNISEQSADKVHPVFIRMEVH